MRMGFIAFQPRPPFVDQIQTWLSVNGAMQVPDTLGTSLSNVHAAQPKLRTFLAQYSMPVRTL